MGVWIRLQCIYTIYLHTHAILYLFEQRKHHCRSPPPTRHRRNLRARVRGPCPLSPLDRNEDTGTINQFPAISRY